MVQERPGCGAESAVRPVGRGEGSPAHPLRDGQEHHRFVLTAHYFRYSLGNRRKLGKSAIRLQDTTENPRNRNLCDKDKVGGRGRVAGVEMVVLERFFTESIIIILNKGNFAPD